MIGKMKLPAILAAIVSLGTIIGGGMYVYAELDQSQEVLINSEAIRLNSYQEHQYHYDDISDRVVQLSSISNRDSNQERDLLMYQARKDNLQIKLERLSK